MRQLTTLFFLPCLRDATVISTHQHCPLVARKCRPCAFNHLKSTFKQSSPHLRDLRLWECGLLDSRFDAASANDAAKDVNWSWWWSLKVTSIERVSFQKVAAERPRCRSAHAGHQAIWGMMMTLEAQVRGESSLSGVELLPCPCCVPCS